MNNNNYSYLISKNTNGYTMKLTNKLSRSFREWLGNESLLYIIVCRKCDFLKECPLRVNENV